MALAATRKLQRKTVADWSRGCGASDMKSLIHSLAGTFRTRTLKHKDYGEGTGGHRSQHNDKCWDTTWPPTAVGADTRAHCSGSGDALVVAAATGLDRRRSADGAARLERRQHTWIQLMQTAIRRSRNNSPTAWIRSSSRMDSMAQRKEKKVRLSDRQEVKIRSHEETIN